MRARVFVTLKPSVFDPQGTTVAEALHTMGYTSVSDVRQGKYFELDVDTTSAEEARRMGVSYPRFSGEEMGNLVGLLRSTAKSP